MIAHPRYFLYAVKRSTVLLTLACGWLLAMPVGRLGAEEIAARAQRQLPFDLERWHAAGWRGKGVKVAILDSGWKGYRSFLGKVLPEKVTARSFRVDGNLEARDSQHGILCAEVIHALAPGAELLFANWEPDQPSSFLDAIRWARKEGARVVSCSCIMPDWSDGEGGGAVHEAMANILGAGKDRMDLLMCGCAGNTAKRHWSGQFRSNQAGLHEWASGQTLNALRPWGDERVSVELYCRPGATYEITVTDSTTKAEVVRSSSQCRDGRCTATARFLPNDGSRYQFQVRLVEGKPGPFHLVSLHSDLDSSSATSSICFPADGRYVLGIGAVDGGGRRCSYSACGPNSPCPKPDLVAPVPFRSGFRAKPFAGTSAATPQAAALAALVWSSHLDWTADRVRTLLQNSARDLGPKGHDGEFGYGLIRLPEAVPTVRR